jgi:hypothetical protein
VGATNPAKCKPQQKRDSDVVKPGKTGKQCKVSVRRLAAFTKKHAVTIRKARARQRERHQHLVLRHYTAASDNFICLFGTEMRPSRNLTTG